MVFKYEGGGGWAASSAARTRRPDASEAGAATRSDYPDYLATVAENVRSLLAEISLGEIVGFSLEADALTIEEYVECIAGLESILDYNGFEKLSTPHDELKKYQSKSGVLIYFTDKFDVRRQTVLLNFGKDIEPKKTDMGQGESLLRIEVFKRGSLDEFTAAAEQAFSSSGLPLDLKSEFTRRVLAVQSELAASSIPEIKSQAQKPSAEPEAAPELYDNRKDKTETPVRFLERVWGSFMEAGVLYKDTLNRLDPKISPALSSYCHRMRKENPDRTAQWQVQNFLPPQRPKVAKPEFEPGSAEAALQKRREKNAKDQAAHRERVKARSMAFE